MKRTLAILILLPFLLWYWVFWGIIFIVCVACYSFSTVMLWLARTADDRPEPLVGLYRATWANSYPLFIWNILIKGPLSL